MKKRAVLQCILEADVLVVILLSQLQYLLFLFVNFTSTKQSRYAEEKMQVGNKTKGLGIFPRIWGMWEFYPEKGKTH